MVSIFCTTPTATCVRYRRHSERAREREREIERERAKEGERAREGGRDEGGREVEAILSVSFLADVRKKNPSRIRAEVQLVRTTGNLWPATTRSPMSNLNDDGLDYTMTISGNTIRCLLALATVLKMQALIAIVAGSLARVRFREILFCWVKIYRHNSKPLLQG